MGSDMAKTGDLVWLLGGQADVFPDRDAARDEAFALMCGEAGQSKLTTTQREIFAELKGNPELAIKFYNGAVQPGDRWFVAECRIR